MYCMHREVLFVKLLCLEKELLNLKDFKILRAIRLVLSDWVTNVFFVIYYSYNHQRK